MNTTAICKDDQRRDAVRRKTGMNGLDYLDVSGDQRTLTVYFLGKAPSQLLKQDDEKAESYKERLKQYVYIEGGARIRRIRVTDIEVTQAKDPKTGEPNPELDDSMEVRLDKYGDFSTYTLRLVGIENIDPFYDHIDFSFKVDCPSDLDCAPIDTCPPPELDEPEINYLAKDYASFRQLILDRLSLIMPDWKKRHVPDLGIALVEVLAYVGDHLSYYQDAVATEAYLDTARQRISVRRHARLVDYYMHEGCNARAWICIKTDTDLTGEHALDPKKIFFTTAFNDAQMSTGAILTTDELRQIPAEQYEVFEPMTTQAIQLFVAHNKLRFYTWGQRECCLPRGATSATLRDEYVNPPPTPDEPQEQNSPQNARNSSVEPPETPSHTSERERQLHLDVGDVLIFEEVIGPRTGNPADADPSHRHVIRLTRVTESEDTLYNPPIPVLEIEWAIEDALPFPLCISAITDASHGCHYLENISLACGNVILVDHGRTQPPEDLDVVPCTSMQAECNCADHLGDVSFTPGRFRPVLSKTPLTFSEPLPQERAPGNPIMSAKRQVEQNVRRALPQIGLNSAPAGPATDCEHLGPLFRLADRLDPTRLISTLQEPSNPVAQALRTRLSKETLELLDQPSEEDTIPDGLPQALIDELGQMLMAWSAKFDLLNSGPDDSHVVIEIDNDGTAHLRFGNGELGRLPEAGSAFFATYRIGNGVAGNVGAEAISHLMFRDTLLSGVRLQVRNPLPARGGTEPEPMAEVKLFAPFAFRKEIQRAITAGDYAELAQRDFESQLQGAAATLAWTGSWYEAQVAVDPFGRAETDLQLLDAVKDDLYRYRRIGHDLAVLPAHYVPLDIEMTVCVLPGYLRGHVKRALLDIFSNRVLPKGRLGFFHPDNLTFGEGIYLSKLVALAQTVTGVESVKVTRLQRLYEGDNGELDAGVLRLSPLEVARLDNDPSFPEHGRLGLDVRGER
ncbi:MAG: putative baseplate assembly protein [Anaerolineales bacterium]|jgi:hypothetical protein